MVRLLIATTNPGKLAEAKKLFDHPAIDLVSLADLEDNLGDINETGQTFRENALLKAEYYATHSNYLTVADDSGLEVKALDNKPGVKSARWVSGSDDDRNVALLAALKGEKNRLARFVTVACLFDPKTKQYHFFEGVVSGVISERPLGNYGFGYDPLFVPDGYKKTFAQLGEIEKNKLSHRAKAYKKLKAHLFSVLKK